MEIKVGDYVKHFKRETDNSGTMHCYKVLALNVIHTETKEKLAIYQAMYDDGIIYARPMNMFFSKRDKLKYPNYSQEYRLEVIRDKNLIDKIKDFESRLGSN